MWRPTCWVIYIMDGLGPGQTLSTDAPTVGPVGAFCHTSRLQFLQANCGHIWQCNDASTDSRLWFFLDGSNLSALHDSLPHHYAPPKWLTFWVPFWLMWRMGTACQKQRLQVRHFTTMSKLLPTDFLFCKALPWPSTILQRYPRRKLTSIPTPMNWYHTALITHNQRHGKGFTHIACLPHKLDF
jgi:hypothetical protein